MASTSAGAAGIADRGASKAAEGEQLDALRRGEEGAFRELVRENEPSLRRVARVYVANGVVDEVVQETWIAVINGLDGFHGNSKLSTWIHRILLNLARRRGQREQRIVPFASMVGRSEDYRGAVEIERLIHPDLGLGYWPAPPDWQRDPETESLAAEVRQVVDEAIESLSDAQREVITLRDVEGWSAPEVCDVLTISEVNQRTTNERCSTARASPCGRRWRDISMGDSETARQELWISCADALELMTDHIDEALSPGDRERMRAHLAGCEACGVYLDQLRATIRVTGSGAEQERYEGPPSA